MLVLFITDLMCSSHLQLFCKIIPRCLWDGVSFRVVLPKVGCWFWFWPLVKFSCSLNLTFIFFAHSLIFSKSWFSISACESGLFSAKDKLVSSANNLITDSILLIYIVNINQEQKTADHRYLWDSCWCTLKIVLLPFNYSILLVTW